MKTSSPCIKILTFLLLMVRLLDMAQYLVQPSDPRTETWKQVPGHKSPHCCLPCFRKSGHTKTIKCWWQIFAPLALFCDLIKQNRSLAWGNFTLFPSAYRDSSRTSKNVEPIDSCRWDASWPNKSMVQKMPKKHISYIFLSCSEDVPNNCSLNNITSVQCKYLQGSSLILYNSCMSSSSSLEKPQVLRNLHTKSKNSLVSHGVGPRFICWTRSDWWFEPLEKMNFQSSQIGCKKHA